ncbi:MAG TPA: UvrD-helicase domain-containing protein, partial [Bacillales bacterium]|nr:UvrD-helicase domain-containing protein [Bacillales bacterium]
MTKHPASLHLRRQLSLLNRAQISTIHSFCMNVLRRYYYKIGLDPAFRVIDQTEAELMREEICEELFEEEYGKENNDGFYKLVDCYTGDRSDIQLQTLVENLYDFSRSHPHPEKWLEEMAEAYLLPENAGIDELPWTREIIEEVRLQLEGLGDMLSRADRLTGLPGGPAAYHETFLEDSRQIAELIAASKVSWNELYALFQTTSFGKLKPVRGDHDEGLKKQAKQVRDTVKKQVDKIRGELFARAPEQFFDDLRKMAPHVRVLSELVKAFARRYQRAKLDKGLIDFDDSQHYCLEVLSDPESEPGKRIPADSAHDYRQQFEEVLVDEYQDTNFVQEAILELITGSDNLFMVGDVKQSIYRFRQAEPGLFLSKYKSFRGDGEDPGLRIDLSENFRSREEVLSAANFLFR